MPSMSYGQIFNPGGGSVVMCLPSAKHLPAGVNLNHQQRDLPEVIELAVWPDQNCFAVVGHKVSHFLVHSSDRRL